VYLKNRDCFSEAGQKRSTGLSDSLLDDINMAQVHTTILATIAAAFNHLKDDVHTALHTQLGDAGQLEQ